MKHFIMTLSRVSCSLMLVALTFTSQAQAKAKEPLDKFFEAQPVQCYVWEEGQDRIELPQAQTVWGRTREIRVDNEVTIAVTRETGCAASCWSTKRIRVILPNASVETYKSEDSGRTMGDMFDYFPTLEFSSGNRTRTVQCHLVREKK